MILPSSRSMPCSIEPMPFGIAEKLPRPSSFWSFMQKGVAALRAHPADYALAEKYFAMGACVQPNNADLHDALREVRAAMRLGQPDEL